MLTCLHGAVTFGFLVYVVTNLSSPSASRGYEILMAPLLFVLARQDFPEPIKWLLFVANSALWAAVAVIVITRLSRWRDPRRSGKPA